MATRVKPGLPASAHPTGTEVFICHSSADARAATDICAGLEASGVTCWIAPRERRSGTSIRGRARLCKTGNARVRKALYMPAMVALRFNPTLRIFAERLLAAGKHKRLIIGAVMRKLLVLAYGILRSGVAFDANCA